ncbi:DUF4239 domain-containing protein [Microvirga terricola]|uniref:DUF4239 domain-containing protein n=1 Tax=Microvirga terricola TaxID=2719797 RepID=A0ABX0VDM5_9HYPH|nr:DUF4239 domain-containing protein [Microvirga terricola]NIX77935.1 DUF4239 domain-containing protein [Microvirga terricola]
MFFLTVQPLWLSVILLFAVTLLAMAATVLVRRRITLDRLKINNEVAGFTFATVGVLYAVLLAFAVIIVWQKFNEAEAAAAKEAGAAVTLYRLSNGIGGDPGAALRDNLTSYVRKAVVEDWPAMERSESSHAVTHALDATYAALLTFNPDDRRGAALLAEALHQFDVLTEARRTRLVMASGAVPGVLWFVLFGGAVLTVGFTLFFGTESMRAQALMTGILSFLIFSGLLVIVVIDHPFAGPVKVQPEALSAVMRDFGTEAAP